MSSLLSFSFCLSATLFDRDRAFVDSDFGVFHDSSGAAAIDAMGRPIGRREMEGGSEEEDTRQPNGILLFAREEASLVDFRVALSSQRSSLSRKVFCRLMIIRQSGDSGGIEWVGDRGRKEGKNEM